MAQRLTAWKAYVVSANIIFRVIALKKIKIKFTLNININKYYIMVTVQTTVKTILLFQHLLFKKQHFTNV